MIEQKTKVEIEQKIKQKKQIQYSMVGKIIPYEGHKIWKINKETLEIELAKYTNINYVFGGINNPEILVIEGHEYISALNKENALKKYLKGSNGSKPIENETLKLI